jgi:tRNA dimethylallyltransferase
VNKVIIILGPTGVGKTGFSILLARALKTEIISADSMLVYRYMDIGTAKPSPVELETIPHHLINILSPDETFSAGIFKKKAIAIINNLNARDKVPLVVGGTGLYIKSLTRGLFEGPGADEALRKKLKDEEQSYGKGHLYHKLKTVDSDAARKIEPNDLRRTVRALEVYVKEKRGISEIQELMTKPSDYDFIKIGLVRDRKELYRLIEERIDKMMDDGLLEETKGLLKMKPNRSALQALGYKEMKLYLDGELAIDEAVRLTKKRTKMYAKRQFTWFRKETDINWVDITGIMDSHKVFAKVTNDVKILQQLIYSYT